MLQIRIYLLIFIAIVWQISKNQAKKVRTVELTNDWTLRDLKGNHEVPVPKLPSGVFTALKAKYGDILHSKNDVNLRWIANETWIYSQTFDGEDVSYGSRINLTFYGIDTIASIRLNDILIGKTRNMFARYSFEVTHLLKTKQNLLEVEILSPLQVSKQIVEELRQKNLFYPPECTESSNDRECHVNMLRKSQMSFGGRDNPVAPSMGIWKPVVLELYDVAILRDIDVAILRNETHWTLDIHVFLSSSPEDVFHAVLTLYSAELLDKPFEITTDAAKFRMEFKVDIPTNKVQLWWPNGYGEQKLYPLHFILKSWRDPTGPPIGAFTTSQKTIKIGFRTIEIIEDVDDRGRPFYFKINGHPIFIKGANYAPAHILPELSADTDTLDHLLKSARNMHMNMIRVWGGGLYESDAFYNLADYYGLLIWQDMAFSKATYPVLDIFLESIRKEASQNAKRLAYHPSLALLVTNNEVELYLVRNRSDFAAYTDRLEEEYKLLFMGTIRHELSIISRNGYKHRPGPMVSTPSMGIEESKKVLAIDPQSPNYGDVHLSYETIDEFAGDALTRSRFISEFGYPSLPIMSSWQRTLGESKSLEAIIKHRQHDPNGFSLILNLINSQLPFDTDDWKSNIEKFIYFSQVAQALHTKFAFEFFRSERYENNTMGALMQLNEVWVAPTLSCVDFYGNYKLLYYWAKEFLEPERVIALYDAKNDVINITITREDFVEKSAPKAYRVVLYTYNYAQLFPKQSVAWDVELNSNEISRHYINLQSVLSESQESCFFKVILTEDNTVLSTTFLFPTPLKQALGISDPKLTVDIEQTSAKNSYSIKIVIKRPALFVYMELNHPDYIIDKYRFSDNGFVQVEPVKIVHLDFTHISKAIELKSEHIKVFTLNQYFN